MSAPDLDPQLDELFTRAPCGLLAMDLDGTIRVVNDEVVAITGRDRAALTGGLRLQDLLAPGGAVFYETHISPLLQLQGFARELALDLVRPDATRRPVLVTAAVHDGPDGRRQVEVVVLDATERREYERELLVSNRRVERLQRMATRFAASLDAPGVGETALEEIVDGIKADLGVVTLLQPGALRAVATRLDSSVAAGAWAQVAASEGTPAGELLAVAEPVFIEGGDGQARGLPDLGGPGGRCSRLAVLPLVVDAHAVGLLCLGSRVHTAFDRGERLFLAAFTRTCAQALERARLHDLTAAAGRQMEFFSELGRSLTEPLLFADRAQKLVELLVPEHADFATVEVAERGPRPVAAQHADAAMLDALVELRTKARVTAEKDHSLARARSTLEPQLLPEIPETTYEQYDLGAEELQLLRRLAPRSYIGLPLLARGQLVGTLMLAISESPRRYTEHDLAFYVEVAERAALALENARLYEQQQDLALRLQRSFLPADLPEDPRIALAAVYRPTTESLEIGGDWYDTFLVGPDRLGVAVGDVVGHNEEAALVMGRLSTALRAFALEGGGPGATIARLSHFAGTTPGGLCTTVCYAEVDLAAGALSYACAGHPPPVVRGPSGEVRLGEAGRSPALGVVAVPVTAEATMPFAPGSQLLLFTDGLVERRGVPIDESIDALVARVAGLPDPMTDEALAELVDALVADGGAEDDLCVLILSLLARPAGGADRSRQIIASMS